MEAGPDYTMLLNNNRNLKASKVFSAGNNADGQLGREGTGGAMAEIAAGTCVSIAAGGAHNLLLTATGKVYAWGNNENGQIGNNSTADAASITDISSNFYHETNATADCVAMNQSWKTVFGIPSMVYYGKLFIPQAGVYAIHTRCAGQSAVSAALHYENMNEITPAADGSYLLAAGSYRVKLMPDQEAAFPQLVTFRLGTPQELIESIEKPRSVSAGDNFTLLADQDGTVWSWGKNEYGQLGDGTTIDRPYPIMVEGLENIIQVAAGPLYSLALTEDGRVYSWGYNMWGQLGDGELDDRNLPALVALDSGVCIKQIAAGGDFALALADDGTLYGWGSNFSEELGEQECGYTETPLVLQTGTPFVKICAGYNFSVALTNDGRVFSWGNQLRIGGFRVETGITEIPGITDIVDVAAKYDHALIVNASGEVYGWGDNQYGQLGVSGQNEVAYAMKIDALQDVERVYTGKDCSAMIKKDGSAFLLGGNSRGELGNGTLNSSVAPVSLHGNISIDNLTFGQHHAVAISKDGCLYAWGDKSGGQIGDGAIKTNEAPKKIPEISDVKSVSAGDQYSVAVKNDGTVWLWGYDFTTNTDLDGPTQIEGLTSIKEVVAGSNFCMALKTDGTVLGWGDNSKGQLGDGTTTTRTAPVAISGISGVSKLAVGHQYCLALKNDGTVWAWGYNNVGQLGLGNTISYNTPQQIINLSGIIDIAAGRSHSLALGTGSAVYAWGDNSAGQLGDGTTTSRSTPAGISTFTSGMNITCVAAGGYHSLAVDTYKTYGWGSSAYNSLGPRVEGAVKTPQVVYEGYNSLALAKGSFTLLHADWINTPTLWGYAGEFNPNAIPSSVQFAFGNDHILYLHAGQLWAFGNNTHKQLGWSSEEYQTTPLNITDAIAANHSFETALDLGEIQYFQGAFHQRGKNHYYKFRVALPGKYSVDISGNSFSASIYTKDSNGNYGHLDGSGVGVTNSVSLEGLYPIYITPGDDYYLCLASTEPDPFTVELTPIPDTEEPNQYTVGISSGMTYDFTFEATTSQLPSFVYTLRYATSDFEVITLCTDAEFPIQTTGSVPGVPIDILTVQPGLIQFRSRSAATSWNGPVNTIRLRALHSGNAIVELKEDIQAS